jgi:hypothetical protein
MDQDFGSISEITGLGGITLENIGPGLDTGLRRLDRDQRPRPTSTAQDQLRGSLDFSGAWMGMDGSTLKPIDQGRA